jgi:hypothetical protein
MQLVIDKNLATLPRRKSDNAIIVRSQDSDVGKARVFKLNAVSGEPILLERYIHAVSPTPSLTLNLDRADMNASTSSTVHDVPCLSGINHQRHLSSLRYIYT